MIIIDSSHAIIAATARASKDFGIDGVTVNDVRSYFLTLVANVKKMFGEKYGNEVVFAFDSKDGYWRKDIFPYYKIKRKERKANAPFDYEFADQCISILFDELNLESHYKAVRVSKAEGDDVIASIVMKKCSLKNDLVNPYDTERVMIISSDGDLVQLQRYQGVDQYSTTQEKYVREENPEFALFEKIVRGDAGDCIPSSLTPDDHYTLVEKVRQKSIYAKSVNEWWEEYNKTNVLNESISTYYSRNKKLIDFDEIPEAIVDSCLDAYLNAPVQSKTDFMNYVTRNKLHSIIDKLQNL